MQNVFTISSFYSKLIFRISIFFFSSVVFAQSNDVVLKVMKEELDREMQVLGKITPSVYFIDYRINDIENLTLKSSFGCLTESFIHRQRVLNTKVKVGSYNFDNSHPVNGQSINYSIPSVIPFENDEDALRVSLWESTQEGYKTAKEFITQLLNMPSGSSSLDSIIPDFSKEKAEVYYEPAVQSIESSMDRKLWEKKIADYSAPFLKYSEIVKADVTLSVNNERKYYTNTEGTSIVENSRNTQLTFVCNVKTDERESLPFIMTYHGATPSDLPSDSTISSDAASLIRKLILLSKAPAAEPYTGPAILSAKTAGVFFHEIFGHRVEGHRFKNANDGQTFANKIREQVLPESISINFDPTVKSFNGKYLNGNYVYDDEGVKGQAVPSVENGMLRNVLMSRTPVGQHRSSNGHGRTAAGGTPVSRQSNLIVQTTKPNSRADLRKMLIKECKKQDKEYGYLFEEVVGGYTFTDRSSPNVFNIFPIEVYRIYVDGRPDQLVKGVNLIGTPLSMFAEIKACGDMPDVFNGVCGAESGGVPVSAVSPDLFVRRIETQRKAGSRLYPELLARPAPDNTK